MRPALHYRPPTETDPADIAVIVPAEEDLGPAGEVAMSLDEADAFVLELRALIARGRQARPPIPERNRYADD